MGINNSNVNPKTADFAMNYPEIKMSNVFIKRTSFDLILIPRVPTWG